MADSKSTTKQDLPFDVNINGVQYTAGKDVEIQSDHADAVNEVIADHQGARDFQSTHHGAVPAANDPQEATAQTPTRPLGGEHVRQPQTVKPATNSGDAVQVVDPNAGDEAATEAAKGADKVSQASATGEPQQ